MVLDFFLLQMMLRNKSEDVIVILAVFVITLHFLQCHAHIIVIARWYYCLPQENSLLKQRETFELYILFTRRKEWRVNRNI